MYGVQSKHCSRSIGWRIVQTGDDFHRPSLPTEWKSFDHAMPISTFSLLGRERPRTHAELLLHLCRGEGTPKDAQTQLRQKDILTTLNVYTQPVPTSVRLSVETLDSELQKVLGEFWQAQQCRSSKLFVFMCARSSAG